MLASLFRLLRRLSTSGGEEALIAGVIEGECGWGSSWMPGSGSEVGALLKVGLFNTAL